MSVPYIKLTVLILIGAAIIIWKYNTDKKRNKNQPKKGENKRAVKILLVVVVLIAIVGIISRQYSENDRSELLLHRGITTSKIESYVQKGAKSSDQFKYKFSVYGSVFQGEHIGTWPNGGVEKFIGKRFLVIYDSLNPSNECMLISSDDFKYYNMSFPDSLNWVLPYYK